MPRSTSPKTSASGQSDGRGLATVAPLQYALHEWTRKIKDSNHRERLGNAVVNMGQCPPTPAISGKSRDEIFSTSFPLGSSLRQEERASPHTKSDTSINSYEEYYKLQKSFLTSHRPDRLSKCILDPNEVYQALEEQAGIGNHPLFDQSLDILPNRAVSPAFDAQSEFGGSEFTTATSATKMASNKVPQWQEASPPRSHIQRGDGGSPQSVSSGSSQGSPVPATPTRGSLLGGLSKMEDTSNTTDLSSSRPRAIERYMGLLTSCIQPAYADLFQQKASVSVLNLKVKAHLGRYFLGRYRPMFPGTPLPRGMSMYDRGDPPGLIKNDSDSTSSEGGDVHVGFGPIPTSHTVLSGTTGSAFMDLSITGTLGLVPRHKSLSGRKEKRVQHSNQKSPDQYVVLMNRRSGTPLAVCALKATNGLPIVRIYATKQRVAMQRSAAMTGQLGLDWTGSLPLYAWAEVVTESMYPQPEKLSVYMASGSDGKFGSRPSYVATSEVVNGSPIIKVLGRTDQENRDSGCALISLEVSDVDQEDLRFSIDVAHGMDPALFLCLTAILDEVMEKSMRFRCKEARYKEKAGLSRFL